MSTKAVSDLQGGIRGDGWSAHSFLSHSEVTFRPKSSNPNSSTGRGSMSPSSPGTPGPEAGKGTALRAEGPARLVDGTVLRLPQLPGTRQVICLCLSLSSPITLRHLGHDEKHWLDSPLCSWACCISPLGGRCSHSPLPLWLLSPHFACYSAEWKWKPTEAIFISRPRKGIWNSTQFHI